MFKLIVGLANFDVKYFKTRHNVGAWYIQKLITYNNQLPLKKEKRFFGYTGNFVFCNSIIKLLIPDTYMNRSGISILSVIAFYGLFPEEILIVHDELDLSPGKVQFKFSGGHNGHNGVRDIIKRFKKNNFYRLRIGIGRPKTKDLIKKFVLSEPPSDEKNKINTLITKLIVCTEMIIFKKVHCINKMFQ